MYLLVVNILAKVAIDNITLYIFAQLLLSCRLPLLNNYTFMYVCMYVCSMHASTIINHDKTCQNKCKQETTCALIFNWHTRHWRPSWSWIWKKTRKGQRLVALPAIRTVYNIYIHTYMLAYLHKHLYIYVYATYGCEML